MMGLIDSFVEKRERVCGKEEKKEYLFCKSLTADLMTLPTEYEWAKNEIWNVVFKYQMTNMRRAQFLPEKLFQSSPSYNTIQPHPVQSTSYAKLSFNPATPI